MARLLLAALLLALAGCAGPSARSGQAGCAPAGELAFVCGAEKPEDLAAIPGTRWLIASGFSSGAGLKLVDTRSRRLETWFRAAPEQIAPDRAAFPDCADPPDPALFNARGLSLRAAGAGRATLLVVNHGGRESIEVFSVEHSKPDLEPRLVWRGCLALPDGHVGNSVSAYRDGTILVSVLTRPGTTITDFVKGDATGIVLERAPSGRFRPLPGTELRGNNGLGAAPDDSGFFVVSFGSREIVAFARASQARPLWRVTAPDFMPDNIHWHGGRLIAAGMVHDEPACGGVRRIVDGIADTMRCHRGTVVAALDPVTRSFEILVRDPPNPAFNGVSAAAIVGGRIWLGSYQADRLAVRALTPSRR
jgi:hypothetical protein